MNNTIHIESDNINLYVTLSVRSNPIGIILLKLFIFSLLALLTYVTYGIDAEETGGLMIPIFLAFGLFIYFPAKYLCWNLWGTEHITINTKALQYYYDFGFIRTNPKTVTFKQLGIGYEQVRGKDEDEIGKLLFINYRMEDNIPESLYETTVLGRKADLESLNNKIIELFDREHTEKHGFKGFHLN